MPGRRRKAAGPKTKGSPDDRIDQLINKSIDYLESELTVATGIAGNATEVIRIIKALGALRGKTNAGSTDQDSLRRSFTFVESEAEG